MRALLLTALTGLALTAPATADIADLRARVADGQGQVWIGFDEQPGAVSAEVTETGLTLTVSDVAVRGRAISPASDELVAAVSIDPTPVGGVIRLYASRSWSGVRAELRQGGVLVTMQVGPAPQVHVADTVLDAAMADTPASAAFASTPELSTPEPSGPEPSAAEISGPQTGEAQANRPASTGSDAASNPVAGTTSDTATPVAPTPLFDTPAARANPQSAVVPPGVCVAQAEAVAANPWDDELLHAQAICLSEDGHPAAAAAIYEQMLAFEPENFRATVALAEIRVEQGDTEAARDLYDQAAAHAISDAEAARARSRLRALRDN